MFQFINKAHQPSYQVTVDTQSKEALWGFQVISPLMVFADAINDDRLYIWSLVAPTFTSTLAESVT